MGRFYPTSYPYFAFVLFIRIKLNFAFSNTRKYYEKHSKSLVNFRPRFIRGVGRCYPTSYHYFVFVLFIPIELNFAFSNTRKFWEAFKEFHVIVQFGVLSVFVVVIVEL